MLSFDGKLLTFALFAAASLIIAPQLAHSERTDTIREKLSHYQDLASRYDYAARRIDGRDKLPGDYTTLDVKEHSCGVLGELLGISDDVVSGWTYPDPGLLSTNTLELRLFAISLKHYTKVAHDILQEDEFVWRYTWNLNCDERYNYRKWFEVDGDKKFAISLSEDGNAIRFVGAIAPGSFDAFSKFLLMHDSVERVELSSFGGRISEALRIGRLIREKGLTTVTKGNCNSACTLVFIGGIQRLIRKPHYSLGFHRASAQGIIVEDDDYIYEDMKEYADEMIGSGREFVLLAKSGEGWDYYHPAKKTLCELNIATLIEGVCEIPAQ